VQSVAALAFATNKLALGVAFHRRFANQAAFAIEAEMAATRGERLAWIGNGRGNFERQRGLRPKGFIALL